jgi:hypothetical protein
LPYWPNPFVLFIWFGLIFGLPVGIMMAVPVEVLQPENRAAGRGLFYSFYYGAMTALTTINRISKMKSMLIIVLGIYALSVALACILWRNPVALALCYILISLFMLSKWHAKSDLVFYFTAFVLGPIGELAATHYGAWKYSRPIFLIPLWLPLLWGTALLFMKKLCETLQKKEK